MIINTGQEARLMTRLVTLSAAASSSINPKPLQPITIRSAFISSPRSKIVKAGISYFSMVSALIPCLAKKDLTVEKQELAVAKSDFPPILKKSRKRLLLLVNIVKKA